MALKPVPIFISRVERLVPPGAQRGTVLINLAELAAHEQLLLEVPQDVDIPIAPKDVLIIRGGERFSVGDGDPVIDDNPALRKPVAATLNEQALPDLHKAHHAKFTGAALKAMAGDPDVDLWVDLDDLADEKIGDTDRLILQAADRLFTAPRDHKPKTYVFFVGTVRYETDKEQLTGAQIKAYVPDVAPGTKLSLEGHGDEPDRIIGDDDPVLLDDDHGPRRFILVPPANFG